jgi:CRP-like cAMP-binding protein
MDDISQINVRASKPTTLLEFSIELYEDLISEFPALGKRLMLYQNKLLRQKSRHLDYIEQLPKGVHPEAYNSVRRENVFKNAVYKRILEIKEEKAKPKLGQVMEMIKKNYSG